MASGDGDGATEFHDYEGGGIGEGDGTKDVSDKIENEDQVMKSELQVVISHMCGHFTSLVCLSVIASWKTLFPREWLREFTWL